MNSNKNGIWIDQEAKKQRNKLEKLWNYNLIVQDTHFVVVADIFFFFVFERVF